MQGSPTYQIDGAEIYLGSEETPGSVYFLTNSMNIKNLASATGVKMEE